MTVAINCAAAAAAGREETYVPASVRLFSVGNGVYHVQVPGITLGAAHLACQPVPLPTSYWPQHCEGPKLAVGRKN